MICNRAMGGTLHVIGAGLSGLSCALRVALGGRKVAVYEAATRAGGRCRSFHDEALGRVIDNGNHLLLGANSAVRAYLGDIGRAQAIKEIAPATFPFLDLTTGASWTLRPAGGWLAFWIFEADRRVPGSHPSDYLRDAFALMRAKPDQTVADCVSRTSVLFECLWQPVARAALNTDATEASATLLWQVVAATLLKGEAASRPTVFPEGLSATLIDPAIDTLRRLGADIRYRSRLRGIEHFKGRVTALHFPEGLLRLDVEDAVALAVPPDACAELWPEAQPPRESRAIVNAHYRLESPAALPGGQPFLGLIGAESQWLFTRGDVLSVTISAADAMSDEPGFEVASKLWSECARALGRNVGRLPPWRIIKEKRATFAQTPAAIGRRAGPVTSLANLVLAGDWTDTGLPATIEGSVRSGFAAAAAALSVMDGADQEVSA
jgi:squalene-associated FAD-dependent desaturase